MELRRRLHQARHAARTAVARQRPHVLAGGWVAPAGMRSVPAAPPVVLSARRESGPVWRMAAKARDAAAVEVGCDTASVAADRILLLGAAGAVLVAPPAGGIGVPGLPPRLMMAIEHHRSCTFGSPDERELQGVRVRRAAWRHLRAANGSVASVSVLLASRRPDDLDHALGQLRAQIGVDFELVVGLHGEDWPDGADARIGRAVRGPVTVIRCQGSASLGAVLQELTELADGDVVTKWDDDDWYGPNHLDDLMTSLHHSDADLVGKVAEFVRLEELDVTIRRDAFGAESFETNLAGGTLMMRRSDLLAAGGWPDLPRHVDRALIDRVQGAGGWTYRTHGFEYVLRRRHGGASGHTWAADDHYFVRSASSLRRGLDLEFAGFAS